MSRDDDKSQLNPVLNGLQSENLDDYMFDVDALVAGTKPDERKFLGPRVVRRLGGIPGALARRALKMVELAEVACKSSV